MRTTIPLLLLLSACVVPPRLPEGHAIGEPMVRQDAVPFATIDANPAAYFEKTVLVEATVTAVCQTAGCWMQVEDQGRTAVVRWESGCGGQFAFPPGAVGRRVLIQAVFVPKPFTEEQAEHIQAEAAEGVTIARSAYEFNASAVLVPEV